MITIFIFPSKTKLGSRIPIRVVVVLTLAVLCCIAACGEEPGKVNPIQLEKSILEVFGSSVTMQEKNLEGDLNDDGSPDLVIRVRINNLAQAGRLAVVQNPWADSSGGRTEELDQSEECRFHALLVVESGKTQQRYILLCAALDRLEILKGLRVITGRSCEEIRTMEEIFHSDVIYSAKEEAGGIIYRCASGYCWQQWGD